MDTFTIAWLVFVSVVLFAGLVHSWWWPRARRERLVRNYAARRSLVLDAEAGEFAERLLVAVQRGRYLGAILPLVVGYPILAAAQGLGFPASSAFLVVILVGGQIAAAAGGAIAMYRAARMPPGHRAAHLRSLRLGDFMPPLLRWWSAGTMALSTAAVLAALVVRPADPILARRDLVLAWIASAGLVVAAEAAAQVLLRAPQPAASPSALAVRDEIKGDLLAVIGAGALGPTLITIAVAGDFLPEAGHPVAIAMILPLIALESQRRRRVRDRLWHTEPDNVTRPRPAS